MSDESGIVYALTNDRIPDLVKIGFTQASSVERRMRELSTTGVPGRFRCCHAVRVADAKGVENLLHFLFREERDTSDREFFEVKPDSVKYALMLTGGENVTPQVNKGLDFGGDGGAAKSNRRADFSFADVEIPVGAVLEFAQKTSITAAVIAVRGRHTIKYDGKKTSLSAAAQKICTKLDILSHSVRGPEWWQYDGELLSERRNRMGK